MKPVYSTSPALYRDCRPSYGSEIYSHISSLLKDNQKAWDCACGSGQATIEVAKFVDYVIGTDPDPSQLEKGAIAGNVDYLRASETVETFGEESIDLVTVATGIHWINRPKFYKEVERVLKKGGVLATWGYTGVDLNSEIDAVIKGIVKTHLMPYYPKEILIAFNGYQDIELPMNKIQSPNFDVVHNWDFEKLMNYIQSFTAMQRYLKTHGKSAVSLFRDELLEAWGGDKTSIKNLTWELHTNFSRK